MPLHETEFGTVETIEFSAEAPGEIPPEARGEIPSEISADTDAEQAGLAVLLHASAAGPGSLVRLGKALAAAGYQVVIPALHGYGGTWVGGDQGPIERSVRVATWTLTAFPTDRKFLFGQSMGGLVAGQSGEFSRDMN